METKDRITLTAFDLFIERGYNSVSVREIVEKAGISKGAFYHYFPSKGKLLETVMDMYFLTYYNQVLEVLNDKRISGKDKFRRIVELYNPLKYNASNLLNKSSSADMSSKDAENSYLLMVSEGIKEFPVIRGKISDLMRRLIAGYERMLIQAKNEGDLPASINPKVSAVELAAIFEGTYTLYWWDRSSIAQDSYMGIFSEYWKRMKYLYKHPT